MMPIYEYRCSHCARIVEKLESFDAPGPKECLVCHHTDMRKIIGATSFILKGKGWYKDHYGLKPSKDD
jgi:putative FmdB family regulatory protein